MLGIQWNNHPITEAAGEKQLLYSVIINHDPIYVSLFLHASCTIIMLFGASSHNT